MKFDINVKQIVGQLENDRHVTCQGNPVQLKSQQKQQQAKALRYSAENLTASVTPAALVNVSNCYLPHKRLATCDVIEVILNACTFTEQQMMQRKLIVFQPTVNLHCCTVNDAL